MELDPRRIRPAVEARMVELGMSTQHDLATAAGIHVDTLRDLLTGRRPNLRHVTLVRITQALGWPADAFTRLSMGAPPAELRADARSPSRFGNGQPSTDGGRAVPRYRALSDEELIAELQAIVQEFQRRKSAG